MPRIVVTPQKLFCVVCNNEKVHKEDTVKTSSRDSEVKILYKCLQLDPNDLVIKKNPSSIRLCFKCRYSVEEWDNAEKNSNSDFYYRKARQVQATLTVKILESYGTFLKTNASKNINLPGNPVFNSIQHVRRLIYNRYNVQVRLEPLNNEEPTTDVQDDNNNDHDDDQMELDLSDQNSDSGSGDNDDDYEPEGVGNSDDSDIQIIEPTDNNEVDENDKPTEAEDTAKDPNTVELLLQYKNSYPVPPDFIKLPDQENFSYGKCHVQVIEGFVNCSMCGFQISSVLFGFQTLWILRDHFRLQHPESVPCIDTTRGGGVLKGIAPGRFEYGKAIVFVKNDEKTGLEKWGCTHCSKVYGANFGDKSIRAHVRQAHPELAPIQEEVTDKVVELEDGKFRFGAAVFTKKSKTQRTCDVCHMVSESKCGHKSIVGHIRQVHKDLAPPVLIEPDFATKQWHFHELKESADGNSFVFRGEFKFTKIKGSRYRCAICSKKFQPMDKILLHIKEQHASSRPPVKLGIEFNVDVMGLCPAKPEDVQVVADSEDGTVKVYPEFRLLQEAIETVKGLDLEMNYDLEGVKKSQGIPADFVPQSDGSFFYGRCIAELRNDEAYQCSTCGYSVLKEPGLLWDLRDHMRECHGDLVPTQESVGIVAIPTNRAYGSVLEIEYFYGACPLKKVNSNEYKCLACSAGHWKCKEAKERCGEHIRICHPELAPFASLDSSLKLHPPQILPGIYLYKSKVLIRTDPHTSYFHCGACHHSAPALKTVCSHIASEHADLLQNRNPEPTHVSTRREKDIVRKLDSKTFIYKNSLLFHLHKKGSYKCSHCCAKEKSVEMMVNHLKAKHNVELQSTRAVLDQAISTTANGFNLGHDFKKLKNQFPVPGDFTRISDSYYSYGNCRVIVVNKNFKCCHCPFGVANEKKTALWEMRNHMRDSHTDLVPVHGFVKEIKASENVADPPGDIEIIEDGAGTKYFYGACPFTINPNREFKCGVCETEPWKKRYARERLLIHILICHPDLAPLVVPPGPSLIYSHPEITPDRFLYRCKVPFQTNKSGTKFRCDQCAKVKDRPVALADHMETHHKDILGTTKKFMVVNREKFVCESDDDDDDDDEEDDSDADASKDGKNGDHQGSEAEQEGIIRLRGENRKAPTVPYIPNYKVGDKYQCPLCGFLLSGKQDFVDHLKFHVGSVKGYVPKRSERKRLRRS